VKTFIFSILVLTTVAARAQNPIEGKWQVTSAICTDGRVAPGMPTAEDLALIQLAMEYKPP
jgi:hypothetical protein